MFLFGCFFFHHLVFFAITNKFITKFSKQILRIVNNLSHFFLLPCNISTSPKLWLQLFFFNSSPSSSNTIFTPRQKLPSYPRESSSLHHRRGRSRNPGVFEIKQFLITVTGYSNVSGSVSVHSLIIVS